MSNETRDRIADRLREAELSDQRFINVQEGRKSSVDHEQGGPDSVSGNFGIYANGADRLVVLDVDDYGDLDDKSGVSAIHHLPPTFQQKSPHGGTHRLYAVEPTDDGRLVAAALDDAFGANNPNPSWGEVRAQNQYVVGAGSQLDGCDKEWCDACADPDGGHYAIHSDVEIATIDAEDLISVLKDDPSLSAPEETDTADGADEATDAPDTPDDVEERLTHAREKDDKLDRLLRGDYSDYRDGGAGGGVDRSSAERALAFKLAFWIGQDKRAIEQIIEHDASTKKWDERTDDSYRSWVLDAVDNQTEFYEPASDESPTFSPDVDWDEVDRGKAILSAERGVTDPHGDLVHQDGCYGYRFERSDKDGNPYTEFVRVSNFTLETLHVIETYEGKLLTLRVHPASPMEDPYDVQVHPTVFNSPNTFTEEIVRGRTTWFNPRKDATDTLNNLRLTVGHQHAPQHRGTEYIGLHGSSYDEWVTPAGTLSADGWVDEPTFKYYEKGGNQDMESSLQDKWDLSPEDSADYDTATVAEICRHIPNVRTPGRGLPILGWFYAAPLKPLIHDVEGEFNLLQVTGDTEAGKTSTLQLFYELFGADPAPFGCGDTNFTIEKKFAGSCGLPIWLDEYKPTDLSERKLHWLHRRLREVTREKSVSKGQADLGEITFKMRAPVVFSGEQTVTEAAVRRRTVMTHLTDKATHGEFQRAFCELTGASYTDGDGDDHYPEGLDLHEHARAYYRYVLSKDPGELKDAWQQAREKTSEHLDNLKFPDLDGSEFQGLQTIVFGIAVFREFAHEMGLKQSAAPDDAAVQDALAHVVSNIGPEGRRREHIDEFVELLAQAASAGYLEEGVHHRVYSPQMADDEALAFHMPTAFSAVKKYVREYNVEDEYALLGKNDYIDSFRDKAAKGDSYPLAVNHRVRNIENGAKAVVIDPHRAQTVLPDGFNIGAFTETAEASDAPDAEGGDDDDPDPSSLANLDPGYATVKATAASIVEPAPWLQAEGTLDDGTAVVDFVARGEEAPAMEQGETYRIADAKVSRDQDGILQVEYRDGVTTITSVQNVGQQSGLDAHGEDSSTADGDQTAADGGTLDQETRRDKIQQWTTARATEAAGADIEDVVAAVVEQEGATESKVRNDIENLLKSGDLYEPQEGLVRAT